MTPDELDEMERLWAARMHIADIADRLGYSPVTVQQTMARNRARYPYRHKHVPRATAELWVEKMRAGRATVAETARRLGVHPVTVAGWLRRYGR